MFQAIVKSGEVEVKLEPKITMEDALEGLIMYINNWLNDGSVTNDPITIEVKKL